MSRLLLYVVLAVCVGCGGSKPKEEAPKAVDAPKVEAPKVDAAVAPTAPGVPPDMIHFESEYGPVEFGHKKHFDRVNGDCATCHPKIFPQAREPLNYGKARHRSAEEYGTSCATCHGIKGTAFAAERNCQKCHTMGKH
ncbi:MAG: c(7)-type cytochrome triheme domain-containing protein [Bryobacteraceae bacterium]